jgi:hypothetical protein
MKTIEITISIPQGNRRPRTKHVLERIAEILEDKLNEIDGNPWQGHRSTVADSLGIGDTVPMLTAGKHIVEITL